MTTLSIKNINKMAPGWFRKTKRAIMILLVAANTMIGSWGLDNPELVTRLQMWCTTGAIALLEALEILLGNGSEIQANEGE